MGPRWVALPKKTGGEGGAPGEEKAGPGRRGGHWEGMSDRLEGVAFILRVFF